jgi:hypothetical protein
VKCQIRTCRHEASTVARELDIPCSATNDIDLEVFVCQFHDEALSQAEYYVQGLAIPELEYEVVT